MEQAHVLKNKAIFSKLLIFNAFARPHGPGQVGVSMNSRFLLWFVVSFCPFLVPGTSLLSAQSVCARVKIEIEQELTLERQAFDAAMRIHNGMEGKALEQIQVNILFTDDQGQVVLASTDPNHPSALFFIRLDHLSNIQNVDGNGQVAPLTTAEIHWLIIPAPGAAGPSSGGKRYFVGARLSYSLAGQTETLEVAPDFIHIQPMPSLVLDYFLPTEVFGDDPFTPGIEPPIPFGLGVRIQNTSMGLAKNLRIESSQPKIVDNDQGLLVGFKIDGCEVNGRPANPSLLADFGDIAANSSAVARWVMSATMMGQFVEFGAHFTHVDELGGQLTSLIQSVNTHRALHDVLVDLPGRDNHRDFLALDDQGLRAYETDNVDIGVTDVSGYATLSLSGNHYQLNLPPVSGFLFAKVVDPHSGAKTIEQVVRSDGKIIKPENAWLSQTYDKGGQQWHYFFNLFDTHNSGQTYSITFRQTLTGNEAPVLAYVGNKTILAGQQLGFLVMASDPNGTTPSLATGSLPLGATFVDRGNGTGRFEWTPSLNQTGSYPVRFITSDGNLEDDETILIQVTDQTLPNQAPIALNEQILSDEDVPLFAYLSASDPEGQPLTFALVQSPQNGTVSIQPNGAFVYQGTPNYYGSDRFGFTAHDGLLESNLAFIDVTLRPVNDPPTTAPITITTTVNRPSVPVAPVIMDPDPGDLHVLIIESQGQNGLAAVQNDKLFFTPNPNFTGHDQFTFRITDGGGLSVVGIASVTVEADPLDLIAISLTAIEGQIPPHFQAIIHSTGQTEQSGITLDLMAVTCTGEIPLTNLVADLAPGDNTFDFTPDFSQIASAAIVLRLRVDADNLVPENHEWNNHTSLAWNFDSENPWPISLAGHWSQSPVYCDGGSPTIAGRIAYRLANENGCSEIPVQAGVVFADLVRPSTNETLAQFSVLSDDFGAWVIPLSMPTGESEPLELRWLWTDGQLHEAHNTTIPLTPCSNQTPPMTVPNPPFPGPQGTWRFCHLFGSRSGVPLVGCACKPNPDLVVRPKRRTIWNRDRRSTTRNKPCTGHLGRCQPKYRCPISQLNHDAESTLCWRVGSFRG